MALVFSSWSADLAVVLVTCLTALYLYFTRSFSYWRKRGCPCMPPTVLVGSTGRAILQLETVDECLKRVYDGKPDQPVVGLYAKQRPFLMVRSLDVVRSVMVKDAAYFLDRSMGSSSDKNADLASRTLFMLKGKKWRHMRVKLTPTFTSGKIKKMFYLINECGKELLNCIDHEMSRDKSVNVKETVARYSTDVIASCAFGVNANSLADPDSEFQVTMRKVFDFMNASRIVKIIAELAPWLLQLLPSMPRSDAVGSFVRKTFWNVVEHRKKHGVIRKDFVDILMQIKNEGRVRVDDAKEQEEIKEDSRYMDTDTPKTGKTDIKLVDDDFVAQAFIFIIAGFETSSSVVSFALYELAMSPGIQDRMRREIQDVLQKHDSEVTYEAIAEMTYLDMVMMETIRKYPTVPQLERKCLQDYKIPGTEIVVEKGTSVMIPVLGIHRDKDICPEPERFDPERFTPENKSKRHHFAHLPFGEGPRICIGMRFGQMQVKTALVHILTTYQVRRCAQTPVPPKKTPSGVSVVALKDIALAFHKIT
ncbi:cytochrome P450 6j1-like [Bacillus rossius redtenbacheri]|uniref:cytochrome P450 6j1-like n=1 Tax=Bacillus rossius redtenbacheri TaxID=93214 RepID=UPI002FDF08CF